MQNNLTKYCAALGINDEEFCELTILRMYLHTYSIWNAFKKVNKDKAVKMYADFWDRDAQKSFLAIIKVLGITQVPDVKVLGEIYAYATSCAPSLYVTRINNENLHVGYVTWCGNPGVLKLSNTTRFCADDYIRAECAIQPSYVKTYVREAARLGLQGEIEVQCSNPRCANCFCSACQFILYRKGTDISNIPQENFQFVDYEVEYPKILGHVLAKLKRTYGEQAEMSMGGFFAKDLSAWETLYATDASKVSNYYKLIWDSYAELNINQLKLRRDLLSTQSKDDLINEIMLFGLNNMLLYCECLKNSKHSRRYAIDLDPIVRASDNNKCANKNEYLEDVYAMMQVYIPALFARANLPNIKYAFENRIQIENKLFVTLEF